VGVVVVTRTGGDTEVTVTAESAVFVTASWVISVLRFVAKSSERISLTTEALSA